MIFFHHINHRVYNRGSLFKGDVGSEESNVQVGFGAIDELEVIIHHP